MKTLRLTFEAHKQNPVKAGTSIAAAAIKQAMKHILGALALGMWVEFRGNRRMPAAGRGSGFGRLIEG
jgi:hypothetical protein